MFRISALCAIILVILAGGCSEEHGSSPTAYKYDALSSPESLEAEPGPESISLSWDHSGDYREFIVYIVYYSGPEELYQPVDTTTGMSCTVGELVPNLEYCFAVSAVDSSGVEGWRTKPACAVAHSD